MLPKGHEQNLNCWMSSANHAAATMSSSLPRLSKGHLASVLDSQEVVLPRSKLWTGSGSLKPLHRTANQLFAQKWRLASCEVASDLVATWEGVQRLMQYFYSRVGVSKQLICLSISSTLGSCRELVWQLPNLRSFSRIAFRVSRPVLVENSGCAWVVRQFLKLIPQWPLWQYPQDVARLGSSATASAWWLKISTYSFSAKFRSDFALSDMGYFCSPDWVPAGLMITVPPSAWQMAWCPKHTPTKGRASRTSICKKPKSFGSHGSCLELAAQEDMLPMMMKPSNSLQFGKGSAFTLHLQSSNASAPTSANISISIGITFAPYTWS